MLWRRVGFENVFRHQLHRAIGSHNDSAGADPEGGLWVQTPLAPQNSTNPPLAYQKTIKKPSSLSKTTQYCKRYFYIFLGYSEYF